MPMLDPRYAGFTIAGNGTSSIVFPSIATIPSTFGKLPSFNIALVATLGPYIYNIIKSDIAVKEALENFEETAEANNELEINL